MLPSDIDYVVCIEHSRLYMHRRVTHNLLETSLSAHGKTHYSNFAAYEQ